MPSSDNWFSKGKFANKNQFDQNLTLKNESTLPKVVMKGQFFWCYIRFFVVFNICKCKKPPIFWLFQKKYRILHLVKKSKPNRLCSGWVKMWQIKIAKIPELSTNIN